MLTLRIPGNPVNLEFLVLDYNGTLALDGVLIRGVASRLRKLSKELDIHIVSGGTHGIGKGLEGLRCSQTTLEPEHQAEAKEKYVKRLGASRVIAIGNGYNDHLMLQAAALGIAVIQQEGTAGPAIKEADIVCLHICDALDLMIHPLRIVATLRR